MPSMKKLPPKAQLPMHIEDISRERLIPMLVRSSQRHGSGVTLCLPPGRLPTEGFRLPEDVLAALKSSETGAFLFWSLAQSHMVLPPFPVDSEAVHQGWRSGPLQSLLDRPRTVGVFLLRLGYFAVGVFEGKRLVISKTGSRFVKGRHKKGGSSSARFARRHDEQARALFDSSCQTLREKLEEYGKPLDHFLMGGNKLTLQAFEKRCDYLHKLERVRLHRVIDIDQPSLDTLKKLPRLLYMSKLVTFVPDLKGQDRGARAPDPP